MILVDGGTKLVVQGLTGSQGRFHGMRNRAYGTQVVAGVTPGKGGTDVEGIPVFDTVAEAVAATGADASLVLVPARAAAAAVVEAADAGIGLVVCITEGIPLHDKARIVAHLRRNAPGTRLLGPNCPGVICPGRVNIGIIPGEIALGGGPVGVVSRSGTLTYQALYELTRQGIGQTTCVGIGGDPVPGTGFIDCLELFEADPRPRPSSSSGRSAGPTRRPPPPSSPTTWRRPSSPTSPVSPPRPAARWATPAPSCRAPPVGAAAKIAALEAAGASVVKDPTELGRRTAEVLGR